jgi:hypothetical protein
MSFLKWRQSLRTNSNFIRARKAERFENRLLFVLFRLGLALVILFLGWTAMMVVLQGLQEWKRF